MARASTVADSSTRGEERRSQVLSTSLGLNLGAFGAKEWGLLASVALMWGSAYLFIDVGLDSFGPAVVALGRLVFGAVTLALVPGAVATKIAPEDRRRVWLLGAMWMAAPWLLFPIAQQWIASSLAGMLSGAMPLFTGFFAALLLRQLPRSTQAFGLAIGFVGVVAVSWPAVHSADGNLLGVGLVVLATALYGLSTNLAVPLQQRYGSAALMLRAEGAAIVLVAPFGLYALADSTWAWPSFGAVFVLGVFGSGAAIVAMTTLIGLVGATRGSVAIYFIPVVAIILGVMLRGDTVVPVQVVGTALVIVGAYLASRPEKVVVG